MKTIGSEPIAAIKDIGIKVTKGGTEIDVAFDQTRSDMIASFGGLTKRELMTIEFTKTLLGLRHYDNQPIYELTKHTYSSDNEFCMFNSQDEADKNRQKEVDTLTEKALYVTDNLIKALNKEEQ